MYDLLMLGDLSVRADGEEMTRLLARKHEAALLVYLALEGPTTRESVATLFWADKEEEKARHSLSQALYELRKTLGNGCVRLVGDRVSLDGECFKVDVLRLERAVEEERWADAVELCGGQFLPGFYLRAPGFESWLEMQRGRLARLIDRVHAERIAQLCSQGDVRRALAVARRWVVGDPLGDRAQRYLIELLALAGLPAEALRQYERYAEQLSREYDLEPPADTQALVQRVRSGEIPVAEEVTALNDTVRSANRDRSVGEMVADRATNGAVPGDPLERTRGRRLVQILLIYAGFAWISLEVTGLFREQLDLPRAVFIVVLLLVVAGLPLVLLFGALPPHSGDDVQPERGVWVWRRLRARSRAGRVIAGLSVVTVALIFARGAMEVPVSEKAWTTVLIVPLEPTQTLLSSAGGPVEHSTIEYMQHRLERLQSVGLRALNGSDLAVAGVSGLDGWLTEARRHDADYVVTSRVWILAGDSVEITMALYHSSGERLNGPSSISGGISRLPWLVDLAALEMYEALAAEKGWPRVEAKSQEAVSSGAWALVSGMEFFRQADFDRAIAEFRRAIAADTGYAAAYVHLALAEYWYGEDPAGVRTDSARTVLAEALEREDRLSIQELLLARAHEAYLAGNVSGALRRYERAVERYPDDTEARLGLADSYQHLGPYAGRRPRDAMLEWERLLNVDSTFSPAYYHLVDLAFLVGDTAGARAYLDRFLRMSSDVSGNTRRSILEALVALAYGERSEREHALDNLPRNFWDIIKQLVRADRLELADSVAARMTLPGRTLSERQRGHEYRFVILTALGRYEEAAQEWAAAVRAGMDASFNPWVVMSYLAGHPTGRLARPMLDSAMDRLADPSWPDGDLEVVHPEKKRFRGLVQYAALRGDSALVMTLRQRIATNMGSRFDTTLVPAYTEALDGRLALLAHDSTAAAKALERSLGHFPEPLSAFLPATVLAPQRLLLARLLLAEGDVEGALRWVDSFEWSMAIVDAFFRGEARALREEIERAHGAGGG